MLRWSHVLKRSLHTKSMEDYCNPYLHHVGGEIMNIGVILWLLQGSKGHDTIVTFVYHRQRMAHCIPVPQLIRAGELGEVFVREVVRLHGSLVQLSVTATPALLVKSVESFHS